MQISQISSNLFYPLNTVNNRRNESEGNFASLLENKLNTQDAAISNQRSNMLQLIPDAEKLRNISSLSNAEFRDIMTSAQTNMTANGITVNNKLAGLDFAQMSDDELSEVKAFMAEKQNFMHNMISTGGMFGIGGISGGSEMNFFESYFEAISNAISSINNILGDEEEDSEELFSQGSQTNNLAVADIVAMREKARELFA